MANETPLQLPDSFEDILNNENKTQEEKHLSLDEKFAKERLEWSSKIASMSKKIRGVSELNELQVDLYTERQIAVEYYHYLISVLSQVNKSYRKQWAEKFEFYTTKADIRYPNEKKKELKILSDISDIVGKREAIDNHSKFIDNTIKTIDNLIYGIKYRIEIEQIKNGR